MLAGAIIAWGVAAVSVNDNHTSMMKMMGMHTTTSTQSRMDNDDMSMGQMIAGLQGKTGDDFDKVFLSEMITHHQGAIDMANLAKTSAKHQGLKDMADDILAVQSKEIGMMQTWQTDWNYKTMPQSHMMNH